MKRFVALGQVDSGKSTLCGHLLYKCGYIDERNMDKIRIKAKEDGMEPWIWARVLDIYEEEQARGKTHEFDSVIFDNKKTGKQYELIDTPGHQKFVRSMIEGISQNVNIAIAMISMKDNEFEAAMGNGMMREHLILSRAIGIDHLILIANKMDLIDWDEKKCKEKIITVTKYVVKTLGWPKDKLYVVPISAFTGTGLIDTDGLPNWYKGKSFIETLDSINDVKTIQLSANPLIIKECDKFVCDITNLGSASSCDIIPKFSNNNSSAIKQNDDDSDSDSSKPRTIVSSGSFFIMHFSGEETDVTVEKISNKGKPFIKSGEEAKCIMTTPRKINICIGLRVIFRKSNNTIAFGTITKIF